jgi:nucleoside-diphosphate-sugar epimerase
LGYALETAAQITGSEKEPRMTRFLAAQLAKSHYFDISRAKTDFDYRPKVSNSEGMKRLAKSMQKA